MQVNLLLGCSSGAVKEGLFLFSTKASGSSIEIWSKAEHCKSIAAVEINVELVVRIRILGRRWLRGDVVDRSKQKFLRWRESQQSETRNG